MFQRVEVLGRVLHSRLGAVLLDTPLYLLEGSTHTVIELPEEALFIWVNFHFWVQ